MISQLIYDKFRQHFSEVPILVRSPARINLIGEHTDYNDGIVLPTAIDKEMVLAIAPSGSKKCKLYAADLDDLCEFRVDDHDKTLKLWPNYFKGVLAELKKLGHHDCAVYCAFGGDIPIGAGLASSAAITCGFVFSLNEIFHLGLGRGELRQIAYKAEKNFVGVQCGVMDQFANLFSQRDSFLKLDCLNLECELLPFASNEVNLLLLDTQISHKLASSEYNLRRNQCEIGLRFLKKMDQTVRSLRHVSAEMLLEAKPSMDPTILKRCEYVVEEMARVQRACLALRDARLNQLGELMFATHAGLRDKYEVSCPELDFLVALSQDHPAVLGARLMGAGFGGCTINLVQRGALEDFAQHAHKKYQSRFNRELKIHVAALRNGTSLVSSS